VFTGIIENTGRLVASELRPGGRRLRVEPRPSRNGPGAAAVWDDPRIGESIAVDGCCLTLVAADDRAFAFDVIEETLRRTTLGLRRTGDLVHLERALRVGDRLGGHLVSGHIDGTGRVVSVRAGAEETILTVEIPRGVPVRVVHKGSVAIDGVSLTIAAVDGPRFAVALIPHTLAVTNLGSRREGDLVNLESDPIGRWVETLLVERGVLPPIPGGNQ
jgi:riboflavin synthase